MAILDLLTLVGGLNRSEFLQKYSHRVNKPNQVQTDAFKLQKQPFEAKASEASFEVMTPLPSTSMVSQSIRH